MWSPSWISGFRLLTRDYHLYNTEGISSTHKYGCSRWNFVPNYCRTDRRCCMLYAVRKLYLLPPVLSQHIGYLVDTRLVMSSPSCSPVIFRKSHQSVSANSKRLKNGVSKWRSGVFHPPICNTEVWHEHVINLFVIVGSSSAQDSQFETLQQILIDLNTDNNMSIFVAPAIYGYYLPITTMKIEYI